MNLGLIKLSTAIKHNKTVRTIAKPFAQYNKDRLLRQYQRSEESKKITVLKDLYYGESCFIIGNGPSLTINDLEKLDGKHTFAANRIYSLLDKTSWRPQFYTCVDHEAYKEFGNKIMEVGSEKFFFDYNGKHYIKNDAPNNAEVYYVNHYEPFKVSKWGLSQAVISEDISKFVSASNTVTFVSMQIAIYMGFKNIYLVGVDHQYARQILSDGTIIENKDVKTYAEGILDSGVGLQCIDATTNAYEVAQKYCENHDVKIYNATRGGKLEVFPRVDFDHILLHV
ncbi:MAG: DUF115 domain-containing protein [Oscillospiraceae bacterium]|nr:DUF115 domain-containing protein [Oscillospiraceae bacterium]